jgi:hypothetical protein
VTDISHQVIHEPYVVIGDDLMTQELLRLQKVVNIPAGKFFQKGIIGVWIKGRIIPVVFALTKVNVLFGEGVC